jgi:hypothetical protein
MGNRPHYFLLDFCATIAEEAMDTQVAILSQFYWG